MVSAKNNFYKIMWRHTANRGLSVSSRSKNGQILLETLIICSVLLFAFLWAWERSIQLSTFDSPPKTRKYPKGQPSGH